MWRRVQYSSAQAYLHPKVKSMENGRAIYCAKLLLCLSVDLSFFSASIAGARRSTFKTRHSIAPQDSSTCKYNSASPLRPRYHGVYLTPFPSKSQLFAPGVQTTHQQQKKQKTFPLKILTVAYVGDSYFRSLQEMEVLLNLGVI